MRRYDKFTLPKKNYKPEQMEMRLQNDIYNINYSIISIIVRSADPINFIRSFCSIICKIIVNFCKLNVNFFFIICYSIMVEVTIDPLNFTEPKKLLYKSIDDCYITFILSNDLVSPHPHNCCSCYGLFQTLLSSQKSSLAVQRHN